MTKICTKCGVEKDIEEFYFRKKEGYYRRQCKQCCLEIDKEYRIKNADYIKDRVKKHIQKPEIQIKRKEYRKKYKKINAEKIKIQSKEYREKNKEYIKQWHKENYKNNKIQILKREKESGKNKYSNRKEYFKKWRKNKIKNDPEYKLKSYMLSHFTRELKKKNIKKNNKMFQLTGFKYSDYINHFRKDNLWNNFIIGENIHTDHIIPISAYDFNNYKDIKKCWNPKNLRLLPAEENQSKNNNLDFNLIKQYQIEHLLPEKLQNAI